MSESSTCGTCNHIADRRDLVVIHPLSPLRCKDVNACGRRQKRDAVLADMQSMVTRPKVHPVDKFSRISIAFCLGFLVCTAIVAGSYLMGL